MADDRNTPQGAVAQVHSAGRASPPPPGAPPTAQLTPPTGSLGLNQPQKQNSPLRGPRTLLLRRSENGFGFTLRHFIVYPPELCCQVLPGHERTRIDEPMDTIFVKQVRSDSPASEAGLRTGDRVVSVDGAPTRGEQYASVVQRIQHAGPWLRLLVVSKEDDILQRYFGETAHNPETNQRMSRVLSPDRVSQKHRRSTSMIPGGSGSGSGSSSLSRPRQSWICQGTLENHPSPRSGGGQSSGSETGQRGSEVRGQQGGRRSSNEESRSISSQGSSTCKDPKYETSEKARRESIYSRPSSEQIYDRINDDPIYERVRGAAPGYASGKASLEEQCYPMSRAEPQVPIYRPGRRIMSRRASEGCGGAVGPESPRQSSLLSPPTARDSSPASKESLSSFDSNSTLTATECSDDSVIMTRLRKSFEQKEEFLRRPSHPTGWLHTDPRTPTTQPLVRREFYARPQKLQRQVWPPSGPVNDPHSQRSSLERLQNCMKTGDRSRPRSDLEPSLEATPGHFSSPQNAGKRFYSSLYEENGRMDENSSYASNNPDLRDSTGGQNNKIVPFVSTLSRIHENITSANRRVNNEDADEEENHRRHSVDLRNGASSSSSSLPSSPAPDKKNSEAFHAQGLQIVSRRAKQFESGRLLSDDDEPTSDRTNLYKSELSRLSSKRSVPNVALRKREFESKAECRETPAPVNRESKSLDSGYKGLSGNRIIPVGGRYIHCEPPPSLRDVLRDGQEMPEMDTSERIDSRGRSNSVESWEVMNGESDRRGARTDWQTDDQEAKRNAKAKRQDSYLQAVRTQLETPIKSRSKDGRGETTERPKSEDANFSFGASSVVDATPSTPQVTVSPPQQPVRPNNLPIKNPLRPLEADQHAPNAADNLLAPSSSGCANGVVLRREKSAQLSDEERATRRVSYLKATWGERMHVDSDLELSDSESIVPPMRSSIASDSTSQVGTPKDIAPVEREGFLHVKFTVLEAKRSTDRSWKQVWGVLRGPILGFYKDRHSQSPSSTGEGEAAQSVDVRCSLVDVADDYTKRKHVLRVANPTAEVLLQTEDAASMALWLRALHKHAAAEKPSDGNSRTSKQQAVPQTPGPTSPSASANQANAQRTSPLPSHKGIKKLTSFRNRSPTGQSPVNKTRKPSQTVEPLASPKTKTWKGRVAKQLRRMHGQAGSSPIAQLPPEGATFKVPLELCPMSSFSEYVPLIVEMCTSIVEARGLEVIGIYRVPGNTAAISQLTESVNKRFENINLQDPRWSDVNVISSLLKSFFRQLPDSLLTADLYPMFIDADKIEDPQRRMATIRKLLRDLPEHHFETLKHLMFHLKRVVEHSEVNKMEAKNLAIVFGPTLVRASGSRDNMVTMVTDMSHQCRIVESLLNNVDWFFCEEDLDDLSRLSVNLSLPADGNELDSAPTGSTANHNLLLNNIHKVEGMREIVSARDIVSSIISAANRKIQRRRKGQDEQEIEDHEDDKRGKEDSAGTIRASMALGERECTVSEMVMMHEKKKTKKEATAEAAAVAQSGEKLSAVPASTSHGPAGNSANSTRGKYVRTALPGSNSGLEMSRFNCENSSLDTISSVSSNDTKNSNDEVAITTYAGLSATTQERIRRFEQETKAMLQRDQHRQRREAEKRQEERRRIEMEWQLAKREMENDDILDGIADVATLPSTYLTDRLGESFAERVDNSSADSHSLAVQQQPTARQKAQATSQLGSILADKINNALAKKFKTDQQESVCLAPTRYGSLDSLHEAHNSQHPSSSTTQHARAIAGDISDDGSDLLTSLTSTFDRKWKSLVNPAIPLMRRADGPPESEKSDEKPSPGRSAERCEPDRPTEVYRDPSLHKSPADNARITRGGETQVSKRPDNDRLAGKNTSESWADSSGESSGILDAAEKDESPKKDFEETIPRETSHNESFDASKDLASSYTHKLEKFEILSGGGARSESRSRLKRSESLNKRTESSTSRLKRSESLNKHPDRLFGSPSNGKLKRSESLNKHHADRSESPSTTRLKRSESLTKTEKTESNISKRRQASSRKESTTKLKRKNGMPERSIKRRHTVGGTKDFDKLHWLDNKLENDADAALKSSQKPINGQLRTSSPDLSGANRSAIIPDTSFLIQVSFRGPSNVVFNLTNSRPQSLPPDPNLASKLFKVPLESHV